MLGINDTSNPYRDAQEAAQKKAQEEAAKKSADAKAAKSAQEQADLQNVLYGPGGSFTLRGTDEARAGGMTGLEFARSLYGETVPEIGAQAKEYSQMLRDRLNADYAGADLYRQQMGSRVAKASQQAGMTGVNALGATEQLARQGAMQSAAMNQEYKDKALAAAGRNIGAKQQGTAGQYMAGMGVGQAETPTPVANYGGGLSVICTELHHQGKISNTEWVRASAFGYKLHPNTYFGYLTIATPIVQLMKKSDKFSNLFIGWAKSIAKHKPNLLTKALLPVCFLVGYVRRIKKEEIARGFTR